MKHEERISFLYVLAELEKKMNFKEELLMELDKKIKNMSKEKQEEIITTTIEGINKNEEFLSKFLELKNLKLEEIKNEIIIKLKTNPEKIIKGHELLIKFLIKKKILKEIFSKKYIQEFTDLFVGLNNNGRIRDIINNPQSIPPNNPTLKRIIENKYLSNIFYLNILNLYSLDDKNNIFEHFIEGKKDPLKITIAFYTKITQKTPGIKEILIPLSIILIFTDLFDSSISLRNIGQVQMGEIFTIISRDNELENYFINYLNILYELDLLYDYLEKIEANKSRLSQNYIVKTLTTILENNIYNNELLINYCILFSDYLPDIYKGEINKLKEENKYWYKDIVLENLSIENNTLYNETLEFLHLVKNWFQNKEIKEKVKNFIKENIYKTLTEERFFKMLLHFLNNNEYFDLNYTSKDIGKILIEAFINLNQENKMLSEIYKNLDKIFNKSDIKLFKSKLFESIINNLNNLNEYNYKILEKSHTLLKIEKNQITRMFEELVDIRNNKFPFLLFKLIINNNKKKINKNIKADFNKKLEEVKENVINKEIVKIIDEILNLL